MGKLGLLFQLQQTMQTRFIFCFLTISLKLWSLSFNRSAQHWSLMNTHAAFSCVRPAFFVHGNMRPGSGGNYGPMMQFPRLVSAC